MEDKRNIILEFARKNKEVAINIIPAGSFSFLTDIQQNAYSQLASYLSEKTKTLCSSLDAFTQVCAIHQEYVFTVKKIHSGISPNDGKSQSEAVEKMCPGFSELDSFFKSKCNIFDILVVAASEEEEETEDVKLEDPCANQLEAMISFIEKTDKISVLSLMLPYTSPLKNPSYPNKKEILIKMFEYVNEKCNTNRDVEYARRRWSDIFKRFKIALEMFNNPSMGLEKAQKKFPLFLRMKVVYDSCMENIQEPEKIISQKRNCESEDHGPTKKLKPNNTLQAQLDKERAKNMVLIELVKSGIGGEQLLSTLKNLFDQL